MSKYDLDNFDAVETNNDPLITTVDSKAKEIASRAIRFIGNNPATDLRVFIKRFNLDYHFVSSNGKGLAKMEITCGNEHVMFAHVAEDEWFR